MEQIDNKLLAISIMLAFIIGMFIMGGSWILVDSSYYKITRA